MTHTKSDKPLTTYSVQVFLTDAHGWVAHSHINLELPNFKKAAKMCRDYIRKHIHIGSEGYFEVYK